MDRDLVPYFYLLYSYKEIRKVLDIHLKFKEHSLIREDNIVWSLLLLNALLYGWQQIGQKNDSQLCHLSIIVVVTVTCM